MMRLTRWQSLPAIQQLLFITAYAEELCNAIELQCLPTKKNSDITATKS
jgi:hypothetical protein